MELLFDENEINVSETQRFMSKSGAARKKPASRKDKKEGKFFI
jgi:hypothetical protein